MKKQFECQSCGADYPCVATIEGWNENFGIPHVCLSESAANVPDWQEVDDDD